MPMLQGRHQIVVHQLPEKYAALVLAFVSSIRSLKFLSGKNLLVFCETQHSVSLKMA
jgi:hypothetical protein